MVTDAREGEYEPAYATSWTRRSCSRFGECTAQPCCASRKAVYGRRGPIRYEDLEAELSDIRRSGISVSDGEVLRGVNVVAGPLLARQGQLVGALAVIGQRDSIDMSADGHITRMLRRAIMAYQRATPSIAPARIELLSAQNHLDDRPLRRPKAVGHQARVRRT
jgi:DNA-binding IclR family transcriptional regulator